MQSKLLTSMSTGQIVFKNSDELINSEQGGLTLFSCYLLDGVTLVYISHSCLALGCICSSCPKLKSQFLFFLSPFLKSLNCFILLPRKPVECFGSFVGKRDFVPASLQPLLPEVQALEVRLVTRVTSLWWTPQ